MRTYYRLLHLFIVALLLFGAILPASAESTSQQPCDASAYINQLLTDIGTVDAAIRSADRANVIPSISAYNRISDIRRRYEDNILGVPPCALVLHNLMTQWFAAGGDKVALIMAIAADPANAALYEERITQTDVRLNDLAIAANNEFGRIQGVTAEPEPEIAEPAPPPVAEDWYRVYFTDPVSSDNDSDHHHAFLEQSLMAHG